MTTNVVPNATLKDRPAKGAARAAFLAFIALAAIVWGGIAIGANIRAPGVVGLAGAVFGGFFAAVLTAAIGGWIALKIAEGVHVAPAATSDAFNPELAPALRALEDAQRPITRRMVEQAAWRTPAFAAGGVAGWSLLVLVGVPGGVIDFSLVLLLAGLLGYGLTRLQAWREQSDAYLQRGVGTLAASMGGLAWRKASGVELTALHASGILPRAATSGATGEIYGVQSGVTIRIIPLSTTPPQGVDKAINPAFNGLLIELEAPHLSVTSMEALASFHPAVPVRIGQLAALPGFAAPVSSASGARILIALPERQKPRLFEPPVIAGLSAAAPRLARIRHLIAAVLHVVDALTPR
jgi:hypothetical protein